MNALQVHQLLSMPRPHRLQTFGGRSSFIFDYLNGDLVITPDEGNGGAIRVPTEHVMEVFRRYFELPNEQRTITTQFGNNWPGCPNFVSCPFIARIIHFFETGR
jgi:hypothetical protein